MTRRKEKEPEVSVMPKIDVTVEGFQINLAAETEKIDNRRVRYYARKVSLCGNIQWEGDNWVFLNFTEQVDAAFSPQRVRAETHGSTGRWRRDSDSQQRCFFRLHFTPIEAKKPSLVLGEREAWLELGGYERAVDRLHWAIVQSHLEWAYKAELEDRAAQAAHIRNGVCKHLYAEAKKKIRYDHRYGELREELRAEVDAQYEKELRAMQAELLSTEWGSEKEPLHHRAIEVGLQEGLEEARDSASRPSHGPFRRVRRDIGPKEVS